MSHDITITNLKKSFRDNQVLKGIDITIRKGDVVAIIGPSGTGKSTLLRCVNRLEKPEDGSIRIAENTIHLNTVKGKDLVELRKKTAMVFQSFNLFKQRTALENVMEGLTVVKKIRKEEAEKTALKQLDLVGLSDKLHHYPKHLSGGQQQRVSIARALAMQPELLLFDEPTSALDPELAGEVLEVIKKAANQGYTMLIVSHEMNFVRAVANRVIFMDDGVIVEEGTPKELFGNPKNQRTKDFLSKINQFVEMDFAI